MKSTSIYDTDSTVLPHCVWSVCAVEGPLIVTSSSVSPVDVEKGTSGDQSGLADPDGLMDDFDSCLAGQREGLVVIWKYCQALFELCPWKV